MADYFHGAKAAVFLGAGLLVYQRDRGVPWPGYWDFPGGGREARETPPDCLRREMMEEFGLAVPDAAITWGRQVPSMVEGGQSAWFFVVHLPADAAVCFGDEGQRWAIMAPADVMNLPNLVPALRCRLRRWLRDCGGEPIYLE